ncbi:MAG: hydrogenase iron-sulfur subunit [Anaerolineae bacterium]|nr:hydrogenase iron-sulfur subunit [Anaerolineae bacterium]
MAPFHRHSPIPMTALKPKDPELLPGANPETDCQTLPEPLPVPLPAEDEDEHEHAITWAALGDKPEHEPAGDGLQSWRRRPSLWAVWLEKAALVIEKPVGRLIGNHRLNPFYHTGPIALFLLLVVGLTGFYLFLFFQYGFAASYQAVARYDDQFIARAMRAIHRYASGALVITTLLHAYRTLFMERFRGPRWLAWVTGIVLTGIIWLAGVTGYWLVWDTRAQLINDSFIRFLGTLTPWAAGYVAFLAEAEVTGKSWPILLVILAVHVLLFLLAAGFFWLHIRRLKRAKWLPETHWMVGMGLLLVAAGVAFPLTILPPTNPLALPLAVSLDPLFLFFLPVAGQSTAVLLWSSLLFITILALALPWVSHDRALSPADSQTASPPKVNIIKERCTGCTKCALDCPYGAITMVERHDDKPHKYIAIEDPSLCVSCGICVGSCDGVAVTMGNLPPALLWDEIALRLSLARAKTEQPVKLVFTCERHAVHNGPPVANGYQGVEIIALPCVGVLPPDVLPRALEAGAATIQVIGCPPEDCRNREGNLWTAQRLRRQRVPRLKRPYAQSPITAVWQPPNEFARALHILPVTAADESGQLQPDYMASRRYYWPLTWRHYVAAFGLLLLVLLAQIGLTDVWVVTAVSQSPRIAILLPDPTAPLALPPQHPLTFHLSLDNQPIWSQPIRGEKLDMPFFAEVAVTPGRYVVQWWIELGEGDGRVILFDDTVTLTSGAVLRLQYRPDHTTRCFTDACAR